MKWIDDAEGHLEALEALGLDARQDKVQLRDMLAKDMKKLILAVRLSERLFTRIEQNTRENSNYARACEGRDRLRLGKVEGNPPHKDKPAPSDDKDKRLRDLADDLVDGSFSGADDAKATTSEGEGERWAKALRQVIFCAFLPPLVSRVDFGDADKRLDQLDAEAQRRIKQAALRFRDEVLAEAGLKTSEPEVIGEEGRQAWEVEKGEYLANVPGYLVNLARKIRAALKSRGLGGGNLSWDDLSIGSCQAWIAVARDIWAVKPSVSDKELGSFIWAEVGQMLLGASPGETMEDLDVELGRRVHAKLAGE